MSVLAAVVAALAAWLWFPPPAGPPRARRGPRMGQAPAQLALVGSAVVLGQAWQGPGGGLLGFGAGCVAVTCWRLGERSLGARRSRRDAAEVEHATRLLAGQLRAGQVPSAALAAVARECPWLERAAATQAIGGNVPAALAELSHARGREGVAALARAWDLCERTGAPMAAMADQVGERIRDERATAAVVDAELSGPRTTARLLAVLPLVGIGMGYAVGGSPLAFLLHTLPGRACLAAGLVLACAGVSWTEAMARAACRVHS